MTDASGWYPLALADDIEPSTSTGTRLFGRELVVWRDEAGAVYVWEDRCPHRGMRLSFGFVRGNHIACLYHGWQFDSAGRCRYIPAHPRLEVPASITVERYTAAERLGVVWTSLGPAPANSPPGGNAVALPVRSIAITAELDAVLSALRSAPAPFGENGNAGEIRATEQLLTFAWDSLRLHVAVQPTAERETMLHLSVEPADCVDRQQLSLWAERLRRDVEARAPEMAA